MTPLKAFAGVYKWVIILSSLSLAGGVIVRDRNKEMQDAMKGFGESLQEINRQKEDKRRYDAQAKRQASLDSMQRVNDSLAAEIKRMEIEAKRRQLEREYWDYLRDSVRAARAARKKDSIDD